MTDTTKLTKKDQKKMNAFVMLTDDVATRNALNSAALDGLSVGIDRDIAELDAYNIDAKMAKAEDDVAQLTADAIQADLADVTKFEEELVADDREEQDELLQDAADPEVEGKKLADAGADEQ